MRPEILNPLFAETNVLKGIGPKLQKLLGRLLRPGYEGKDADARVIDLLFHLPSNFIDRRHRPPVSQLPARGIVTIEVTVGRHRPPPRHNRSVPYRIECFDASGEITLVYFHSFAEHLQRMLPTGETRFVSGSIEWYQRSPQIVHPDHVMSADEFARMPPIEPVYPLTAGMSLRVLGKGIHAALDRLPELPEWLTDSMRDRYPNFAEALRSVHHPITPADAGFDSAARQRLAYDELLANQLALLLVRRHLKKTRGRSTRGTGEARTKITAQLPFHLTASQEEAIADILKDMAAGERMMRLLQGDVGSGKTAVALIALATVAEAGGQGALMVPTEILARQHLATLTRMTAGTGLTIDILTGREKGRARAQARQRLVDGKTSIVIGTHALFQEGVDFKNLALVVIDEQHRFGVHQRLALQAKAGSAPDLLVMTATPIPRTLNLTLYGDMDISRLTERPAGRQTITTRVMPLDRLSEVVDGLERAIAGGQRAYWVCPLIGESEIIDNAAAEARFAHLSDRLPGKVGLVHGRMKPAAKDEVMERFQTGDIAVLVSTTVVEVGVDVPQATIMIIDNAERFGLAQLHQLRGRVGRGKEKSSCILLYAEPLSETARQRLAILRSSDDGFLIAEQDLLLRGAGEALGTRQSGMPLFRLADLGQHGDLLAAARDDAQAVLEHDPDLRSTRGDALRTLLYLFERDEAVRLLAAG
jgi:ATP-dependent DNA helicase RecG